MKKIRKDDSVKVVSGNYKGQTGRVIKVVNKKNRAIVEGINKVKKHIRPSQENPQGGIVEKEMSIHMSNLMLMNKNKPVKVGFKIDEKTYEIFIPIKSVKNYDLINWSSMKELRFKVLETSIFEIGDFNLVEFRGNPKKPKK